MKIKAMVKHGSIGKFDGDCETWKSYMKWLIQYFAANDAESAAHHISTYQEHSGTSEAY